MKTAAIKADRVAAAARGSPRCLPGAHEAGRASSSSQRPGSSSPGRRRREEGPWPLGPGTSATPARVCPSMAAPRVGAAPPAVPTGARPGLTARRSQTREVAAAAAAGTGRRAPARREAGEAGAGRGPEPRTGAASRTPASPLRPLRSLEPLPGNARARARGGEHHLPAGRAPACGQPGGRRGARMRGTARRGGRVLPPRTRLPGGGAGGRGRPGPGRLPHPTPHAGPAAAWWPRAFRPRGRPERGKEARQEGSEPETWQPNAAASPSSSGARLRSARWWMVCGAAGVSGAPALAGQPSGLPRGQSRAEVGLAFQEPDGQWRG